jgi:hypothetical protein
MSVRAIAIRSGPRPARAAAPARVRRRRRPRAAFWASFADDRRLIGVKVILMVLLFLAVMALEVPL